MMTRIWACVCVRQSKRLRTNQELKKVARLRDDLSLEDLRLMHRHAALPAIRILMSLSRFCQQHEYCGSKPDLNKVLLVP